MAANAATSPPICSDDVAKTSNVSLFLSFESLQQQQQHLLFFSSIVIITCVLCCCYCCIVVVVVVVVSQELLFLPTPTASSAQLCFLALE